MVINSWFQTFDKYGPKNAIETFEIYLSRDTYGNGFCRIKSLIILVKI